MPRFVYEALDAKGRLIQGEVEAPHVDAVIQDLRKVRFTVTSVKEKVEQSTPVSSFLSRFQIVSLYALAVFTRQLAVLLHSGIPMLRAVQGLSTQSINPRLTVAVQSIARDLRDGFSFSRALAKQPDVFSPVYISMVRAGEMSGAMDQILDRLATYLEREYELRKRVQAATTYPLVIFVACCMVTIFLLNYVFPTFIELFEGINMALPWTTRALITITQTLRNPAVMVPAIIAMVFALVGVRHYIRTPVGRRQWSWLMLEMPMLGAINQKVALNRMCRTLATMLDSGIPMLHSLKIVAYSVNNAVVADVVEEVTAGMKTGTRLSQPLSDYKVFPPMMIHMVRVGEETGNLSHMLRKLADFYDAEIEYTLDSFTSVLEPIMIAVMGLLVGFVLLAVFQPIYGLIAQF